MKKTIMIMFLTISAILVGCDEEAPQATISTEGSAIIHEEILYENIIYEEILYEDVTTYY